MAESLFDNFWFFIAVMVVVPAVVGTLAQAWSKVRRAEQESALKQEMLRRGLTVEEMERLLHTPAKPKADDDTDDDTSGGSVEDLVRGLCNYNAPNALIERVLTAVRAADPSLRQEICRAVQAVLPFVYPRSGTSAEMKMFDETKVLAVLRGLSPPERLAELDGEVPPPAVPARPEQTFQPVRPV